MKKILSMILFLAAAGVGFTLLPSCGGGAGQDGSTKGVMTVNDMKRGKKFFRIYQGATWMDVRPRVNGGEERPEQDSDSVATVECDVVLDREYPGRVSGYRTFEENAEGVPQSAEFNLSIKPENFMEFMKSGGMPWQFFVGIGSSGDDSAWSSFSSPIYVKIHSFADQTGEMRYSLKYVNPPADDPDEDYNPTDLRIEVYPNY